MKPFPASDPAKLAHAKGTGVPLLGQHSPLFELVFEPAITTGVTAVTSMALGLLK